MLEEFRDGSASKFSPGPLPIEATPQGNLPAVIYTLNESTTSVEAGKPQLDVAKSYQCLA